MSLSLKLERFDKASQEVFEFLISLAEEKLDYNIFPQIKDGISISLKLFFEQGANTDGLRCLQFDHQLNYHHLLFQDFDGQAGLLSLRLKKIQPL